MIAPSASAHDFWLMPSQVVLASEGRVDLSLFLGEPLITEDQRDSASTQVTGQVGAARS